MSCPAGFWCWPDVEEIPAQDTTGVVIEHDGINIEVDSGTGSTDGKCAFGEGFLCRSGSWSPRPVIREIEFIEEGSIDFDNYNGPATPGYYATDLGVAVACPVAEYQAGYYGFECDDCLKGRYCPETAMSDLSDYYLKAGHYGVERVTVYDPVDFEDPLVPGVVIGDICPVGYHCPQYAPHIHKCEDGFTSQQTGLFVCQECPEDNYCDNSKSLSPISCVTGNNCDYATALEPNCPNGLMMTPRGCDDCEAGAYCRGGMSVAKCAAGYLCESMKNS